MNEQFYCPNCLRIRGLNKHLRCEVCNSDNIVLARHEDMNVPMSRELEDSLYNPPDYRMRFRSLIIGFLSALGFSFYLWMIYSLFYLKGR